MSAIPDCGYLGTRRCLASAAAPAMPLSSPALWLTAVERGLLLIGLAVALGGLAGAALARNYKGEHPAPLPDPQVLRGSLLGLAGAASLVVTGLADPSAAANLARPAVPGARAHGTVVFAAIELVCFAICVLLARIGRQSRTLQPLLAVVLAESLRSHPEGILPLAGALLVICHLLPAVLWAGMLLYVLRAAIAWRADPAAMRKLVKLYADAAAWLFGVVVATGIVMALLLVPVSSLLTTGYGRLLLVKAALVAIAASLAIAGRVALRRQAAAGAGPARATRREAAVLAAVLVVTGVLTVLTPPAGPIFSTGGAPARHAAPPHHAHVARPLRAGRSSGHNGTLWKSPST